MKIVRTFLAVLILVGSVAACDSSPTEPGETPPIGSGIGQGRDGGG